MRFLRFMRRSPTDGTLVTTVAARAWCAALILLLSGATLHGQIPSADTPTTSPNAAAIVPGMEPLVQARKNVGLFFEQSTNVVCAESVMQTIVGKNGKPAYGEESKYDYQLQAISAGDSLKLQESRDVRKQAFRDAARTLLITKGFATLLLIVHPKYESSYEFEPAGVENDGTATLAKYNFKPVPGASSPAALQLRGKNYPLPLSGSVWIDEATGAITRLTAAVDSSLSDLGLREMQSDIHYALVQFHDPDEAYWMPVSATIDLETPRQHWRNVHRFTAYRRFRASIEIEGLNEKKK
jgi:hypothetical protein